VWNTGNYFWEEKSVAKWSEERIKETLGGFKFAFPGGELKVTSVEDLKGEASVSIRKGKKIVAYDYNCKLKWECSFMDGEGNEVASMKGQYELPEVSSDIDDEGDEWEVRPSINKDPQNLKAKYEATIIRK
jgi:activator of HSP90 ATPase